MISMRTVDIIAKKRDGGTLTAAEIEYVITGYVAGSIPDYQMSALTMAVVLRGMTADETAALTMAMARSGDLVDLSSLPGVKVDKHSTGGVGDKTTLIVAPLAAACGVPVAKMSGRGLGHTGGTIDKLESIPGWRAELTQAEFFEQVRTCGLAVIGQSGNITPADKKLYALRDVTATVESVPLIASSVMSKKIAAGADAIVLDVKVGSGAFMKNVDSARSLAQAMVDIGSSLGRRTVALLTSMDEPLGFAVGNALEVLEAVATLEGRGPADLEQLCVELASYMVWNGARAASLEQAREQVRAKLKSGAALQKLLEFVRAQGGDITELPRAKHVVPVIYDGADGHIQHIDALAIGTAAMVLGAGRATKESIIDYAVGIMIRRKVGEAVRAGDVLAELHVNDTDASDAARMVIDAYRVAGAAVAKPQLIVDIIQ